MRERFLDRLLRHRIQPEALDWLLHARRLVEVGEDELAFSPGVAGVHDQVELVALHEFVDGVQLFLGLIVVGDELELGRDDREVGETTLLQPLVVLLGSGEADEMSDRPGDDVRIADEVRFVLALLISTRQRAREVAADGRLFGDDEGLGHLIHDSEGGKWPLIRLNGSSTFTSSRR